MAPSLAETAMPANRRETNRKFRQDAVLAAAQQVFAEHGLEGATMRAIAQAAGYTAGAVYSYYPTKEAIYAEILAYSLTELRNEITTAIAAEKTDEGALRAAVRAVYGFYRSRPQDLDLGLYVFQGLRPRGLGPELDRQLNSRLIAALQKIAGAIARLGALTPLAAHRETVAVICHLFGVLVLAGTGRLKILDSDPENLIDHYLDGLVARLRHLPG
jgi:AcrR family transcriptional regulator